MINMTEIYVLQYEPFIDWLKKRNTNVSKKCLEKIYHGEFEFCVDGFISVIPRYSPYTTPDYFTKQVDIFNKKNKTKICVLEY
jgi:hypothetical protein